jgi:transposase-like protein
MSMNKIQFQKGLSMSDFVEAYGTEADCQQALFAMRWPKGFQCPRCASDRHGRFSREGRQYWKCQACNHQTSLVSGTIFQATKLGLRQWFQAMYLLTSTKTNVSALELKRHLGVCYRTAWTIKQKLMAVMEERESSRILEGRVEIDDAYLGGENPGGKAGRGSENKIPFLAAVQTTAEGHPQFVVFSRVKTFSQAEVKAWSLQHLATSATVVSDGLACFAAVTAAGCAHQPEVVGTQRKSTDMACFNWVNTVLGNLKTALSGTYHAFDFDQYGQRYLAEAQYRFNRRFTLKDMLPRLLRACTLTAPWPDARLRLGEVPS